MIEPTPFRTVRRSERSARGAPTRRHARTEDGRVRRGAARTEALLDATLELLPEVGYERLTIDAVAARAGASKATIYRRFDGKRELVVAALRRLDASQPDMLADAGSLRGDLVELLRLIRA